MSAISTAQMAITTRSSIRENPRRAEEENMSGSDSGRAVRRVPTTQRGSVIFEPQVRERGHGKRSEFSPAREPFQASRSTPPLTPGTLPESEYCQKLQVLQAGGTYGVGSLT